MGLSLYQEEVKIFAWELKKNFMKAQIKMLSNKIKSLGPWCTYVLRIILVTVQSSISNPISNKLIVCDIHAPLPL